MLPQLADLMFASDRRSSPLNIRDWTSHGGSGGIRKFEAAVERRFEAGQKVLLLLPEETGKMKAKWSGPYTIRWKVDDLNYEVSKDNKVKKYHVNLLAPYFEWVATCNYIATYESPELHEKADYVHETEYTDPHELTVHEV